MNRVPILFLLSCLAASLRAQNLYDDTRVLEFRLELAQPDWKQHLATNEKLEIDIPGRLIVNGEVFDSVGVRYKGHSSSNIPGEKKPFNITMDAFRSGQILWGYTTMNLNNCFKDPTFVREMIGYRLAAEYMPGAKAAYVKLFINGEYWGLYLNVQQLNKVFLREWFSTDAGNHFKGDPRGDMTWLGTDTARYRAAYELKTNEKKNDWSDLVNLIDKLNNLPSNQIQAELPKLLDVDRALWYLAYCNILVNLDSYIGSGHNHYLYHHPVDDRFHIMPWDLNEVLGTFASQPMTVEQREQLPIFFNQTNPQRPLLVKLLAVPDWRGRYVAHFRTLLKEAFTMEYWRPRVEQYQNLIRADVLADTKKLYSMDWFSTNVTTNVQGGGPGGGVIPGIYSLINNRRAYLAGLLELNQTQASIASVQHSPLAPKSNDEVTVTTIVTGAGRVYLWWSANGKAFTRVTMNAIGGSYQAVIPAQAPNTEVRYYIEVFTPSNAAVYFPERAEKEFLQYVTVRDRAFPVVINEVMPGNTRTLKDPQGQFDDWIELYNTSDKEVFLGGLFLSDALRSTRKWRVPNGTTIAPFGYLLVWADLDTMDTPGLHANFRLNKGGEGVFLFDTEANGNQLLDSTKYGAINDDLAWGRIPNGTGAFQTLSTPTPGAVNSLTTEIETTMPASYGVQIYPNPVYGNRLNVVIEPSRSEPVTVTITNTIGNVVARGDVLPGQNGISSVSLPPVSTGIYLVHVRTSRSTQTQRVMIIR